MKAYCHKKQNKERAGWAKKQYLFHMVGYLRYQGNGCTKVIN